MAKATERLFLPFLKRLCPEISDLSMPLEVVFHNCVIVSIKKRYPGQARKVMNFIWGHGPDDEYELIVVVDDDIDLSDLSMVRPGEPSNNIDAGRDLRPLRRPLDALDIPRRGTRYGTRLGVDATRKLSEEGHDRPWPDAPKDGRAHNAARR